MHAILQLSGMTFRAGMLKAASMSGTLQNLYTFTLSGHLERKDWEIWQLLS